MWVRGSIGGVRGRRTLGGRGGEGDKRAEGKGVGEGREEKDKEKKKRKEVVNRKHDFYVRCEQTWTTKVDGQCGLHTKTRQDNATEINSFPYCASYS